MDDKELLELAAKAAGYLNWTPIAEGLHIETGSRRGSSGFYWNPLTDDTNALRLAVKLGMNVFVAKDFVWCNEEAFDKGNDPYAATRRAIVRAAAKIGKEMK